MLDSGDSPQEEYHRSVAWCRLLFGGNRSGKSRAAAQDIAWKLRGEHPHWMPIEKRRIWLLSNSYRTLFEGVWSHLLNVLPHWSVKNYGPRLPGTEMPSYVIMKNGNRLDLITAGGIEEARRKTQAAEVDDIYIDEEIDEQVYTELRMRLLSRGGSLSFSGTLLRSEDWLLELEARADKLDPGVTKHVLITTDNPHNDALAIKEIEQDLSDEEKQVRLLGKSRRAHGLIYSGWSSSKHVVAPYDIPEHWTRYMAMDPGLRVTACVWVAVDPEEHIVAYRELYIKEAGPMAAATAMIEAEREEPEPVIRLMDPAGFYSTAFGDDGIAIRLAEQCNLMFVKANNDVFAGIEAVRHLLEDGPDGKPRLTVFSTCENLLSERRKYRIIPDRVSRDAGSRKDQPVKKDDHALDALRYIAMARPEYVSHNSQKQIVVSRIGGNKIATPLDQRHEEMIKQIRQKRTPRDSYMGTEF